MITHILLRVALFASSQCQALQLSNGARLKVAALTFLHLLPRARAFVSSTLLEGGSLVLDSGAVWTGRSFVANASDGDAAVDGGAALSLPAVHVSNGSRFTMQEAAEPVPRPPGLPWQPQSERNQSDTEAITQTSAPVCRFLLGNLTGNGALECGSSTLTFDAVLLYPTFYSHSPFSPTVYTAHPHPQPSSLPAAHANISAVAEPEVRPAPMLSFASSIAMTDKTLTVLDVMGSVTVTQPANRQL